MENRKAAIEWFSMLKEKFVKTEYEGYLDMAISALEKQVPIKPLPQEMDIDGRAITPCGFCGEELPRNSLYDFCPYCGQKIDRRKNG